MEIDFSQFDDDIKNNFYSDDFAHLQNFGLGKPDANGNFQNLFPNYTDDVFDNNDSDVETDDFNFI